MNSGGSNNVSLKYERYASSGCWDIGIIKLGFVAKTQFLSIFCTNKIKARGARRSQSVLEHRFYLFLLYSLLYSLIYILNLFEKKGINVVSTLAGLDGNHIWLKLWKLGGARRIRQPIVTLQFFISVRNMRVWRVYAAAAAIIREIWEIFFPSLRGSVFSNSIRQTFHVFITFSFFVTSFRINCLNPFPELKSYIRPFTVKENNLCLKIGNNRILSHNSSFRSGFSPPLPSV